jgi:hypothetical protein
MTNKITATPAFVQITFNHSNGCNSGSITLPVGETVEQMAHRLGELTNYGNMTVKRVHYQKEKTHDDYLREWKQNVADGRTTLGLLEWHENYYR